jgi:hypothetical protein
MRGRIASLNAAVAGSVLLFAAAEQRGEPVAPPAEADASQEPQPEPQAPEAAEPDPEPQAEAELLPDDTATTE